MEQRLTFRALATSDGPVGRIRSGSLPGRADSLHGHPSRLEEARRNPSSRFATEERRKERPRARRCALRRRGGAPVGERKCAGWFLMEVGLWASSWIGLRGVVLAQLEIHVSWAFALNLKLFMIFPFIRLILYGTSNFI